MILPILTLTLHARHDKTGDKKLEKQHAYKKRK